MRRILKKSILFVILLCSWALVSAADSTTYVFHGHVYDIYTDEPISGFPVIINVNNLVENVVTDSNGFYTFSYAFETNLQYAAVIVDDCFGDLLYVFFEPPTDTNVANFETCFMPDICEAYFYFQPEIDNPFLINFFDLSEGSINKWTWDFGDYNTSNERNPVHEYSVSGIYQAVLIVEDTNGVCWSAYDEFVFVGEINDCEAYFEYSINPTELLTVMFTDGSEGNISNWMWDFGDSASSEEINPIHTYSEPGVYNVCLMVTDSMLGCSDTYCISVFVGDTISCNADFEARLDTLNNTPHTFLFSDNSTGNISSWFWDFGDGNFSMEQNPVHVYDDGGDYFVCLTVSSDGGGGFQCWDEKCLEIPTLNYYTFGGHVFIDGLTINVEENDSSNVATAFLYRRLNNQWRLMSQREFWKYGYYWFVDKPEGDYLLRVDMKEESVDFGNYAPSYFGDATNWVYGNTLELASNNQLAVNINLKRLEPMSTGVGVILGSLIKGSTCLDNLELGRQIVKLFNGDGKIVAYTYSDQAGEFEFNSLSNGTYKIQGELTGNISSVEYAEISSSNPFSYDHVLEINCNAFVGINESDFISNNFKVTDVFPIPATDYVNLRLQSVADYNINIEIIDQMGRSFSKNTFSINSGESLIEIDVSNIRSGLYFYKVTLGQGNVLDAGKILIKK